MWERIKLFFIKKLSHLLISSIIFTCRKQTVYMFRNTKVTGPAIFLFWHRHIFFIIYKFRKSMARPLISLSKDGELVTHIAREFGMDPIRGSSSRGGMRAFLTLIRTIRQIDNPRVLITADGPKGPAKKIKDGIILLAQKTSVPIIPLTWNATRKKVFENSWDKFMIPLPFSKITFFYGQPIFVPQNLERKDIPVYKLEIEDKIRKLEEEAKLI
jgi:lysophospholipid acyltransferase (LPLAT)-like uncharacterized protein